MRKVLTEVQALRAVAVLSVVIYHLQPRWLPGGYVGVDVFFVISGFLITRHLLREVADRGHISLPRFWANRARRILPASVVVIMASLAAAWFFVPLDDIRRTANQALASTWYFQNWALAIDSVDYMAADNQPSLFQHFWSLSVEEQFYLGWPIILTAAATLALVGRHRTPTAALTHRWLTAAMVVVVLASLGYSVWLVAGGQASAYFDTFGRLWELAAGGLLASLYRDPVTRPRLRSGLSILGFALIAVACLLLNDDTPFPGVAALLPVGGALLVIASGRADTPISLTRLLEWRPVQAIGDWSYSVYLWHFGFVVLATYQWGTEPLPGWLKVTIFGLTIGISALSYRFVEQPFRAQKWATMRLRSVFGLALVGLVIASLAALSLPQRLAATEADWNRRTAKIAQLASSYQVDPALTAPLPPFPDGQALIFPNPLTGLGDEPIEGNVVNPEPGQAPNDCQSGISATSTRTCVAGAPDSVVRVALVGDSHARVMLSPLDRIGRQRGWRIETHLHASCPFSTAKRTLEARGKIRCAQANQAVLEELLDHPPALVVMTAWSQVKWAGAESDPEVGVRGFRDMIEKLHRAQIPVAVIRDTPSPRVDVVRCLQLHYDTPQACQQSTSKALRQHDELVRAAQQVPATTVVSLDRYLCTESACPVVINHIMIYRDSNHITRTWALALTAAIAAQLPTLPVP